MELGKIDNGERTAHTIESVSKLFAAKAPVPVPAVADEPAEGSNLDGESQDLSQDS